MSARIRDLDDFLSLLTGVKPGHNGQFTALCPAHDDRRPSLSVKQSGRRICLKCFAGCENPDILKALDLQPRDLFLDNVKREERVKRLVATFSYQDSTGQEVYQIRRYEPKTFEVWHLTENKFHCPGLGGARPIPYRLPELAEWIKQGKTIYIPEGEGKVDRLVQLGLAASTAPFGAGPGKWLPDYNQYYRDADVVILADNDDVGRQYAEEKAQALASVARRVKLLQLPDLPPKGDVSDWLNKGGTIEALEHLAAQCPEYQPYQGTLPEIVVSQRQLRDMTDEALDALYRANTPERIFRRSGVLTRISLDEKGRPFTEALSESAFRGYLTRTCDFVRMTAKGEKVAVPPPLDVVRDCLSLGHWRFPPLLGITEAPVIRPDGTVISEAGYDSATSLYYFPSPHLSVPRVPDRPTDGDVEAARELALEPLNNFPFDGAASRANAIATMLTPILRPMIDGPVPLAIIDKPQAGTGASLLAEVISLIATGRTAAVMVAQKDDEGWRKAITSLLLKGQLVVTIDNIESTLWAPSLAAILTATTFQDRILGRSEMAILPNRTTWIATGNNIRLAGDLPRRCIWVRLDAKIARPWLRDVSQFQHPHLTEWVLEHRGSILAAFLTIARSWVTAGRPPPAGLPNLGGYESFSRVVGGVLGYMGVTGFLANLDAMYDEADTETPQWSRFLQAWHDLVGPDPVTVAELASRLSENQEFGGSLPDALAGRDSRDYNRRLGNALAKRNGVRYPNGLMIVKAGEKRRAVCWRVVSYENANSPVFTFECELGESSFTPARMEISGHNDKNVYGGWGRINSPNSPLALENGELAGGSPENGRPGHPDHPCPACQSVDWWLRQGSPWSPAEWLCSRCHPKPDPVSSDCGAPADGAGTPKTPS